MIQEPKKIVIARRPGFRCSGMTIFLAEPIGRELAIPPVGLAAFRPLFDQLKASTSGASALALVVDAITFALSLNYRGVPHWLVAKSITAAELPQLVARAIETFGPARKGKLLNDDTNRSVPHD